jgi:hypothetical protein
VAAALQELAKQKTRRSGADDGDLRSHLVKLPAAPAGQFLPTIMIDEKFRAIRSNRK